MTLSNTAKSSLKTHNGYQCKAPKVPYRMVLTTPVAMMSYNNLYLMGFIRGLNEGFKVWRTAEGKVTSNFAHGGSWVYAIARDNDPFGYVADVYMMLDAKDENGKSIGSVVGYLVKADHDEAKAGYCVDFTTDQSDVLGFWVNHEGKSTCPAQWVKYNERQG